MNAGQQGVKHFRNSSIPQEKQQGGGPEESLEHASKVVVGG